MNFNRACEILSVDPMASPSTIKHMYYKKALKLHPDKKGTAEQFQELNDAYTFLQQHTEPDFIGMIRNKSIVTLLSSLDDGTLLSLYKFLLEYKEYIPTTIVDIAIEYIKNKLTVLVLEPTIDDLMNQQIYIYVYNNKKYSIPLWHHELVYDTFTVICKPKLENIELDSDNNIYISVHASLQEVFSIGKLWFTIGKTNLSIEASSLKVTANQVYTMESTIPKIKDNIYTDLFSMIHVRIFFT